MIYLIDPAEAFVGGKLKSPCARKTILPRCPPAVCPDFICPVY